MPLSSVGFVQEEVTLQPTYLECAEQALKNLEGVFTIEDNVDDGAGRSGPGSQGKSKMMAVTEESKDVGCEEEAKSRSYAESVRIFGYSAGAAVGAIVGMVLDGSLHGRLTRQPSTFSTRWLQRPDAGCGSLPLLHALAVPWFLET